MTRRLRPTLRLCVGLWCCGAAIAVAQPAPAPPRGPAEIIGQARRAREQKELEEAPANTPTPAPAPAAGPGEDAQGDAPPVMAQDPHAGVTGAPSINSRPLATAQPNPTLETGSVRVRVLDANERPVAGADVNLGILAAQGQREHQSARTDADGVALFRGLAGGENQAYRVNVPYQGAAYAATPFRMPLAGGYDVLIRRLDTTTSDEKVVMVAGAASIELGEGRLKIVEQIRLVNVGAATYVFPRTGTTLPFPPGFTAFHSEETMTDQRLVEVPDEGVRVEGSLPPGQATLLWGFDLPLSGSEMAFTLPAPWRGVGFRVVADAPPGMTLEVAGMPPAQRQADGGRNFWITERQWRPGEPPLQAVSVQLRGIPGPGILRWVAAALAGLALLVSFVLTGRGPVQSLPPADRSAQKAELLERAASIESQFRDGQIGPEFRADQLGQIEEALAALLWEEARTREKPATPAGSVR